MAASLSCSLFAGTPSSAVSDEAQFIDHQVDASWRSFQESRTLGNVDLFEDLEELAAECGEPDWDGYGAVPINPEAVRVAQRFLRSLPVGAHRPTVGVEPDGHVTFEWHVAPKQTLSVSVSPDGMLHYSAAIGSSRSFGTEPFLGECPEAILDLVQRIQGT